MRTAEQILAKMQAVEAEDFFGTMQSELLGFLPFDAARPHLKDDVTAEQWAEHFHATDEASVLALMLGYMPFAWEKANGCRGLSAARSLDHMKAWLWMLGRDEAAEAISEYSLYGKPQLRAICEAFGWDWRQWDNGRWANSESSDGAPAPASVMALPSPAPTAEGQKP